MAVEQPGLPVAATSGPLAGTVIVEVGEGYAVEFAGHLLATYGATVVKVEDMNASSPGHATAARIPEPFPAMHEFLNAGKLSVSLFGDSPQGAAIRERLEARADAVIRFWEPGEPQSQDQMNDPARIDISWLGRSGPWSTFACDDFLAQHASGMAFTSALRMTDPSTSPPRAVPGHLAEMVAGLTAATAAMVCLSGDDNGRGQRIDISVVESIVSFMRYETVIYSYGWGLPSRSKLARSPVAAPVFQQPTADGFVDMLIMQEEPWRALLRILGNPVWGEEEVFATHPSRSEFWDVLEPMLQEEMAKFPTRHIFEEGQREGIAVAPINKIADAAAADQFAERSFFRTQTTLSGEVTVPGPPFELGSRSNLAPAPNSGDHNQLVLGEWLGCSADELAAATGTR